jgi:K+-sensing histidine kinase KdpD
LTPGRADEHLASVAHDLRTPLNAVCLLVDQLRYGLI